jgi:tyrosyl-tRNA synthetase
MLVDVLVDNGLAESKKKAREYLAQGAITVNGVKVQENVTLSQIAIIKKGKNKFVIVK